MLQDFEESSTYIRIQNRQYSPMIDAVIFDAVRTPRGKGKQNGSLYEVKPIQLLQTVLEAIRKRNELDTKNINDLFVGCATPTGDQGANIAKAALLYSGWDQSVPGMQINRFCASGLESVNLAAMKIRAGWGNLVLAGGVESMSRVPMNSDGGAMLYDPSVISQTGHIPQGVSADLIASIEGITRDEVDAFALSSQQRAFHAQSNGYFDSSIIPVYDQNGLLILSRDEYIRPDCSLDGLGALNPSFETIGKMGYDAVGQGKYPFLDHVHHVHTAGNSSGIVDGASLVLLGTKKKGKELGLKPRARILSAVTVSVEPTLMLTGPTPASKKALEYAGMESKDIDLWEMNEAFAAPVLKFQKDMGIDPDKLNVNGGAIALGHPLGATGAMLLGTLLDELERRNLSTGLVTMCIGGGMGISTVIERI